MGNFVEPDEVSLCKGCPDEETAVHAPDAIDEAINQSAHESAKWKFHWRIDKYDGEVSYEDHMAGAVKPAETVDIDGNMLVNVGINKILDFLIGAAANSGTAPLDATHTRIGVGDTTPTTGGGSSPAASDTDLQAATGSTHRQWKLVSSASRTNQTVSWVATFATTMANFAWSEFAIDNGTADATTTTTGGWGILNHKTISAGTKTSAQTWVATATLTLA